jgi:hypothetical protein
MPIFKICVNFGTHAYSFKFISSGRAGGYASCVQKVQSLCHIDTNTTDELRPFNQSSATQTRLICENKSGNHFILISNTKEFVRVSFLMTGQNSGQFLEEYFYY